MDYLAYKVWGFSALIGIIKFLSKDVEASNYIPIKNNLKKDVEAVYNSKCSIYEWFVFLYSPEVLSAIRFQFLRTWWFW